MNLVNVFVVFVTILGARGQQEDALVELEFKIREERIPAIVNYIILHGVEEHGIETKDLIELSKLDELNLDEVSGVLGKFGLKREDVFTIDNLEMLLKSLDISIGDFYRSVSSELGVSSQLSRILESLEIPGFDFLTAVTMQNDTMVYEILRQGVYDRDHIDQALAAAGKTEDEVYVAARDVILARVKELDAQEIVTSLKNAGLDKDTALIIYDALNITTRDVYEVEKFRVIFTNISESVNQNTTLGVFVAPDRVAVHEIVYDRYSNVIDGIIFRVEAGGLEVSPKKNRHLGEHIVELTTAAGNRSNYVEIVSSYNSTRENCTYVTIARSPIDVEAEKDDDLYTVEKNPDLEFIIGSPLICDGFLSGLAREETVDEIFFDIFYTEDHPPPPDSAEDDDDDDSVSASSGLTPTLLSLFICFVIIM